MGRTDGRTDRRSDCTPRPVFVFGNAGKKGRIVLILRRIIRPRPPPEQRKCVGQYILVTKNIISTITTGTYFIIKFHCLKIFVKKKIKFSVKIRSF